VLKTTKQLAMVQYGTPKKKARKELKRHASTEEDSALFVAILPSEQPQPLLHFSNFQSLAQITPELLENSK
jgi:hypothetical protein